MTKKNIKKKNHGKPRADKRELELKDLGQQYGQLDKLLGSKRATIKCFDGMDRLGRIRGSISRVRMFIGDVVLVSIREFQDDKCDIIFKYNDDEVKKLKSMGEIPVSIVTIDRDEDGKIIESNIKFEDDDEDDQKMDIIFEDI
jgi:translation initiation factor 1A